MTSLLKLEQITCRFPGGVIANQSIDLDVQKGEVHALLGENGAGKSTLMNVAFGMQEPTEGRIFWNEKEVQFASAADAMALGIGMVHQHFMLIPSFTVWENIVLGNEPRSGLQLDPVHAKQRVRELSQQYGLQIDPEQYVSELSVGEQQRVEILKSLYRDIQLLILDEPTAVLTPQETDELFNILRQLVDDGLTIIFISHKLREVKAIADRLTILQKGQKVTEADIDTYTIEELAAQMVGRPLKSPDQRTHTPSTEVALCVENVSIQNEQGFRVLSDISFELHKGEILGVAGVEGNGQSELLELLSGIRSPDSGRIRLHGEDCTHQTVRQRFESGVAHVPQDRQKQGLVMEMSIVENMLLGRHHERSYQKGIWIDFQQLEEDTQTSCVDFEIEPPDIHARVGALSGGNQQKVVIAREFQRPASVYLIAHPTRGVDIGAIEAIHAHLRARQEKHAAILLFSSELPELLQLCDRIAVLYEGRWVTTLDAASTSEAELGIWMTGGTPSQ